MNNRTLYVLLFIFLIATQSLQAQLSVSVTPFYSSPVNKKNSDTLLFRSNGTGFRMSSSWFMNKIGFGLTTGFVSSGADRTGINRFLSRSNTPTDFLQITTGKQQNMYLLFGPQVRLGQKIQLQAHAQGGLFINNAGVLSISKRGAQGSMYRNEPADKSFYPGFQSGIDLQINNHSWSFGVGLNYLKTKTEINNFDQRRGGAVEPLRLTQNISDMQAGITIKYTIQSPRDISTGQSSGRVLPTVNKKNAKRVLPTVNKREIATGKTTGSPLDQKNNSTASDCGPVTIKKTYPDGTIEEQQFACANDAASFVKQTTGAENQINNKPGSTVSGTVSGQVLMAYSNLENNSSTRKTFTMPHVLEKSGTMLVLTSREASSGMATGRRQYQPVFSDGVTSAVCNPCMVQVNPLYTDKNNKGSNPLYEKNERVAGGDLDGDGIADLVACLVNNQGKTVFISKTDADGKFSFTDVPPGNYLLRIMGSVIAKKGYGLTVKDGKKDISGSLLAAEDWINLVFPTENAQKATVNTTRSNIKHAAISTGDLDGDGMPDIIAGVSDFGMSRQAIKTFFQTGDVPTQDQRSVVGGLVPGGSVLSSAVSGGARLNNIDVVISNSANQAIVAQTKTDKNGNFEVNDLEPGNYYLETQTPLYILDETQVIVGAGGEVQMIWSPRSNLDSKEMNSPGSGSLGTILLEADLDGDGVMESNLLNINEVTEFSISNKTKSRKVTVRGWNPETKEARQKTGGKITAVVSEEKNNHSLRVKEQMPVRWMAPESLNAKVWGDPHVDQKDGALLIEQGSGQSYKGTWKATPVAIKNIKCNNGACVVISAKPEEYPLEINAAFSLPGMEKMKGVELWFIEKSGNVISKTTDQQGRISFNELPSGQSLRLLMNAALPSNEDVIITFTENEIIVQKARHDIAMNAIRNMK